MVEYQVKNAAQGLVCRCPARSSSPPSNLRSGYASTGQLDHGRRQVDAERVQAEHPQMRRHVAGAAAEVGDGAGIRGAYEFGECGDQRTVQGRSAR